VDRPDRSDRRRKGKDDDLDAISAASALARPRASMAGLSDRLTVGLISRLARASARKRAYTPAETTLRQTPDVRPLTRACAHRATHADIRTRRTITTRNPPRRGCYQATPPATDDHRPATVAMNAEERAAIRQVGAEDGAPAPTKGYRTRRVIGATVKLVGTDSAAS
jgi:hypothetical protein